MRPILAVLSVIAAVTAFGLFTPAEGGGGEGLLTITKVVEGEGPTGGFVIDYSCTTAGAPLAGSLAFDSAGPGQPESQVVSADGFTTCTVTETVDNGADTTSYACEYTPVPPNSPDASTEGDPQGCLDDRTVAFVRSGDAGTITVTNTFEPEVIDEEEEPPAVGDDDVVTATPPFTG